MLSVSVPVIITFVLSTILFRQLGRKFEREISKIPIISIFFSIFCFVDKSHLLSPFSPLNGELIKHIGKCADGVFTISNFRFFALLQHYLINVGQIVLDLVEM